MGEKRQQKVRNWGMNSKKQHEYKRNLAVRNQQKLRARGSTPWVVRKQERRTMTWKIENQEYRMKCREKAEIDVETIDFGVYCTRQLDEQRCMHNTEKKEVGMLDDRHGKRGGCLSGWGNMAGKEGKVGRRERIWRKAEKLEQGGR